jgi:hypothetical protein
MTIVDGRVLPARAWRSLEKASPEAALAPSAPAEEERRKDHGTIRCSV